MAASRLHGLSCGEEAGARNLVFFRVKWLQATMRGTSCVRRVRLRSFRTRLVPSMCFASSGCSCGVVLCVSWSCGCRSHCNGCMNVAWAIWWGGSRSTKPCVFPCKVAAGDDERYLVCATGAAAVVPDAIGSFYVFCNKWLFLWCSSMRPEAVVADRIVMAAWMLHGLCFGEEAGARHLVFFRVKWLQATMKGTSCVRRVRLRSFRTRLVPSMCFATSGCSCGVVLCVSWSCGCRSHCNGCMNVAWVMFWGGGRSTTPCVLKVARCRGCMRNTIVFCSWTS